MRHQVNASIAYTCCRLNHFGFPIGEEVQREDALNLGLKDQLVALEWLHQNLPAFGGDPSKVRYGEFMTVVIWL